MPTRRSLLANAASGLIFCSCGLIEAARAQGAPSRYKVPVRIGGKRIRTVDTHAHCLFQQAIDVLGPGATVRNPTVKGQQEHFIVIEERLKAMDEMGIDMQVLSINPFWYDKPRDVAERICQIHNEKLAELCAARPERFAAFASLTMQAPDLAVRQLETAVRKLGLKGAAIGGSLNGEDFAAAKFHPVLAKAEELGAVLFIHPQSTPQLASRFRGNGWLSNLIGNPLDTTIALQHLIFEGVLDKYPGLKVLAAHGGGYLASYSARNDHACFVAPPNCNPDIKLRKKPSEYIRQIYVDALVFTPQALRHLVAQVGDTQIVLGTDHPIPWETRPVDHVMGTAGLTSRQREAILGGNAARLFGLKA